MNRKTLHVVFSGGGTGGHFFPGLAAAERLAAMAPRVRITFCGSGSPLERKHAAWAGFEYLALPARPMPRCPREAMAFVVENLSSYFDAKKFIRAQRVATVVGLGGYAGAPMAWAASQCRVPLILLEQNLIPGKATRWFARHASLVCTAFEETAQWLRCRCPIRVTGTPVRNRGERREERGERKKERRAEGGRRRKALSSLHSPLSSLLVLGGSGGARSMNENMPRALHKIRGQLAGWRIVHQSGEADYHATRALYAKLDLPAVVEPFFDDMPAVMASAQLAVSRAGGSTLAELSAAGVPAVLMPYPHATDDHQAANALHYSAGGGSITIDQRTVAGRLDDELSGVLCFLLANEELRLSMASAMRQLARPHAAADVAELIWSVLSSRAAETELAAA